MHMYPYDDQYDYFKYGYLGVRFFFIISGFVIFFTLENTVTLKSFWIKRMIRLVPPMIIISLVILVIFRLFDTKGLFPVSHSIRNLLPGILFISPEAFNLVFQRPGIRFDYLSGSFWSLWPEVQFYLFSSLLYYFNKEKFLRNFLIGSLLMISIFWLWVNLQGANTFHIHLPVNVFDGCVLFIEIFNLPVYMVYFVVGMLFYALYKNHLQGLKNTFFLRAFFFIFMLVYLYFGVQWQVRLIYVAILALFFAFIYFPKYLSFLEGSILVEIGVASYAIYLIHENIGVLAINLWAGYLMPLGFVVPVLLIVLLISVSIFYTRKIDLPISGYLKNSLLYSRKAKTGAVE